MLVKTGYNRQTKVQCSSAENCVCVGSSAFTQAPTLPLKEFRFHYHHNNGSAVFFGQCRHCIAGRILNWDVPDTGYFRCSEGSACVTGEPVQSVTTLKDNDRPKMTGFAPTLNNGVFGRRCPSCASAASVSLPKVPAKNPVRKEGANYYVYGWFCAVTGSPLYVGKGRNGRATQHGSRPGMPATPKVILVEPCGSGAAGRRLYTLLEATVYAALHEEHGGATTLLNTMDLRSTPAPLDVVKRGLQVADMWSDTMAAVYRTRALSKAHI